MKGGMRIEDTFGDSSPYVCGNDAFAMQCCFGSGA